MYCVNYRLQGNTITTQSSFLGSNFKLVMAVLLLLCCLLFSATAVDPPQYVYRADLRNPLEVFINGFLALGNNNDLHDHVSGASCQNHQVQGTTTFVDTTSDFAMAKRWGEQLLYHRDVLVQPETDTFYIYQIRPARNFYNCELSLLAAYERTNLFKYRDDLAALGVKDRWLAAHYGIETSFMIKAFVFQKLNLADNNSPIDEQAPIENWMFDSRKYLPYVYGAKREPYVTPENPPFIKFTPPPHFTACFFDRS